MIKKTLTKIRKRELDGLPVLLLAMSSNLGLILGLTRVKRVQDRGAQQRSYRSRRCL